MTVSIFYIIAISILVFSVMCVTSGKILRSAVYLLFSLAATAGLYFLANYNFLAVFQLTIYGGGIIVLVIFSIMLTSNVGDQLMKPAKLWSFFAYTASFAGALITTYFITSHTSFELAGYAHTFTVPEIAASLVSLEKGGYALPFEVISILLLAAIIGAVIIAKKITLENIKNND